MLSRLGRYSKNTPLSYGHFCAFLEVPMLGAFIYNLSDLNSADGISALVLQESPQNFLLEEILFAKRNSSFRVACSPTCPAFNDWETFTSQSCFQRTLHFPPWFIPDFFAFSGKHRSFSFSLSAPLSNNFVALLTTLR